jgi:hypothetical protein
MSVPGIGPIISSAMVAAIGTGDSFSKGRDFATWGVDCGGTPAVKSLTIVWNDPKSHFLLSLWTC